MTTTSRCSHQYTVSTHCFHPKRKPTMSLEIDTAVIHYHSAIIMLLSIYLSIGAFLYCNFLSFFRLCNLVLLSLHCISFHCIIFVHVCCMMFNKVSVSVEADSLHIISLTHTWKRESARALQTIRTVVFLQKLSTFDDVMKYRSIPVSRYF